MAAIPKCRNIESALKYFATAFIITTVSICESTKTQNEAAKPSNTKLLVIVLDGFRWNYLLDVSLNGVGLAKIMKNGSKAHHLKPVFPTTTFPNLHSIVTGLYPENHGFVSDVMYDHKRGTFFHSPLSVDNEYWWNETEPIWITSTKSQIKTALYMWPGCQVKIHDVNPIFCQSSSTREFESLIFEKNLHDVLIRMSKNEVDFGLVYTDYFDVIGHNFGPGSAELVKGLKQVNEVIEGAREVIQNDTVLRQQLNLIVMSDYGMTEYPQPENQHEIAGILSLDDIEYVTGSGVVVGFYPKADKLAKVYEQLSNVSWAHVWKRADIPENLHVKWHNHTAPILVVTKAGHVILPISDPNSLTKQVPPENLLPMQKAQRKGNHGYDPNEVSDMNGIFLVQGPAFRNNVTEHEVQMVDVYNMMTCILNITEHPNNGSWLNICNFMAGDCNAACMHASKHNGATAFSSCTNTLVITIIFAFFNVICLNVQ